MDTEQLDYRLTRAASHLAQQSVKEVVQDLHTCEQQLVAHRFARRVDTAGNSTRVRVLEVEAALIHVSRALSLIESDTPDTELAMESINHARVELSHASAV
jgi:hypothetical protein